jgi:hypothetical protein
MALVLQQHPLMSSHAFFSDKHNFAPTYLCSWVIDVSGTVNERRLVSSYPLLQTGVDGGQRNLKINFAKMTSE